MKIYAVKKFANFNVFLGNTNLLFSAKMYVELCNKINKLWILQWIGGIPQPEFKFMYKKCNLLILGTHIKFITVPWNVCIPTRYTYLYVYFVFICKIFTYRFGCCERGCIINNSHYKTIGSKVFTLQILKTIVVTAYWLTSDACGYSKPVFR